MSKLQTQSSEGEVSIYRYVRDDTVWFEKKLNFSTSVTWQSLFPKIYTSVADSAKWVLSTSAWNSL